MRRALQARHRSIVIRILVMIELRIKIHLSLVALLLLLLMMIRFVVCKTHLDHIFIQPWHLLNDRLLFIGPRRILTGQLVSLLLFVTENGDFDFG